MIVNNKKLLEVALPLGEINKEASREKSLRHGHPSTLHLWWARRPLAVARAMLFAQLVDDPDDKEKRAELFALLTKLVKWENSNDQQLFQQAQREIMTSWQKTCHANRKHPQAETLFNPDNLPAFCDPFAGGGAIPLEAQRLGLKAYAGDLNPIAVLINKAMLELPTKVKKIPPSQLAKDVEHYGKIVRAKTYQKIGNLYPPVTVTDKKLTVIAYLWARTVKSPNPAYRQCDVPLLSTYILSKKKGNETYLKPIVTDKKFHFEVIKGQPPDWAKNGTKVGRGNFKCLLSDTAIPVTEIRRQGKAGLMGSRMTAIVADNQPGRVYLPPPPPPQQPPVFTRENCKNLYIPNQKLPENSGDIRGHLYGLTTFGDLFTPRQLQALNAFSQTIADLRPQIIRDMQTRGLDNIQASSYANTIITYLAMVLDKFADYSSQICSWGSTRETIRNTFARQALPMVWDYAEVNPFSDSSGNWHSHLSQVVKVIAKLPARPRGKAVQADVLKQMIAQDKIIACDPPYYDNIAYGDLSDFFYVWLRPLLKDTYPKLFATVTVPKSEELIAVSHRHNNDKQQAKKFFLGGMTEALGKLNRQAHPAFPIVIYYAFKQSESNGWETFLEALIQSKFTISGSWPLRTEMKARAGALNTNSLASSIILICRQRTESSTINRREFIRQLREEMPKALTVMTKEQVIDPVDLQQSVLGPGMAIFSRYDGVLKQNGEKLTVREALKIITAQINEFFGNDNFDNDSNFCRDWFKQYAWDNGQFGEAEVMAKSYSIEVEKLEEAGIIRADGGKVRLLRYHKYPVKWQPADDSRNSVWKALHYLIKTIEERGEQSAKKLLQQMPEMQDRVQSLAHYLYQICLEKNLANEAQVYNNFVISWQEVRKAA